MPSSVIARIGPQLRSPSGGYLVAAASARASSTELTIGAMIASAPMSSTRLAVASSPSAMRTTAGLPASAIAPMPVITEPVSSRPCCMSSTTQSNPERAMVSATSGSGIVTQPQ